MRALAVLALALLVVAGCGDDDSAATTTTTTSSPSSTSSSSSAAPDSDSTTSSSTSTPDTPEPAAGLVELSADIPSSVDAGPVVWELTTTNTSDGPITLVFPTAQPGDATLLDGGEVVHRWSDGRFFAQVVQEKELAAGESFTIQLEDDLAGVEPGRYTLRLSLAVVGPPEPLEQRLRVAG